MNFLVLWLGTSIAIFIMEIANELRMFKDVADFGYKIDVNRLSELGKQLNPNANKITLLSMLIPVLNVIQVFQRTIQYNNIRTMILDQLRVIDALEEMSEMEKSEYLKNPTRLNAFIVPLKSEIRLSTASSIKIENSEIYFKMGKSFEDITILKVIGSANRLSIEEQKKKVTETLYKASNELQSDDEEILNEKLNNINKDLSDNRENKKITQQEFSIINQKKALENLKNELLEEQKTAQFIQTDKGSSLSKRRK